MPSIAADILTNIVAAKRCDNHTWREIGEFVGKSRHTVRVKYYRQGRSVQEAGPCPICNIEDAQATHRVSFQEQGNYAEASSSSDRIQSLESLLEAASVDRSVWRVRDWGVKKWEVGAKLRHSDLAFDEGKITGWLKDEGLGVQDLWSVWAKLVRRAPKPLQPVIRPVECTVTYRAPMGPVAEGVNRSLIFSDPHFGFVRDLRTGKLTPLHDRLVLDVVLQVAALVQPARIAILGDFFDFAAWSDRFVRSPHFKYVTQPAIVEGHWWLRQLREACPEAEITLHEGNHDVRMRDAISKHLREACELRPADEVELPPALSPPRLLALHKLQINWMGDYPADEEWLGPRLRLMHGKKARAAPGATARGVVEGADISTVYGHVHRKEMVARRVHTGDGDRTVMAYCPGCTCRIDGIVPGHNPGDNWQQGFGLVDWYGDEFSVYDVEVRGGRAIWDERIFEARDKAGELIKDLGDWGIGK